MPWTTRLLTVAGAAQVRFVRVGLALLLPVELRCLNSIASTNSFYSIPQKLLGAFERNVAILELVHRSMEHRREARLG